MQTRAVEQDTDDPQGEEDRAPDTEQEGRGRGVISAQPVPHARSWMLVPHQFVCAVLPAFGSSAFGVKSASSIALRRSRDPSVSHLHQRASASQ